MTVSARQTVPRAAGLSVLAFAIDATFVLIFAGLGRNSHDESLTVPGLWHTAWPFLAAMVIAWVLSLSWRRPTGVWRSGLPIWVGTVALGLLARVAFTDGGAALPFVLVASGVLGLMFLGWRALWVLCGRLRPKH